MKKLNFALTLFVNFMTAAAAAASSGHGAVNLQKDFDSLGDNAQLVERAQALDPHNQMEIVQRRLVDRSMRPEFGVSGGLVAGGDTYYRTQNLGVNFDFHFNNHWSIGARYNKSYNQLTAEGQRVFDNAQAHTNNGDLNFQSPDIDYPIETGLLVASWYPIYGKLGLVNKVAHFDLYATVGYGKTNLANAGLQDTYAGGGGMAVWWNQYLTSRLEARYQTYQDQVYSGSRRMDTVVTTLSLGIIL